MGQDGVEGFHDLRLVSKYLLGPTLVVVSQYSHIEGKPGVNDGGVEGIGILRFRMTKIG